MKKVLRWSIYFFLMLVVLAFVAVLSINPIAKSLAEKRLRAETGMEARIGKFEFGLLTKTIRISDFRLINTPEFGGATFIYLPELYLELDPEALRENKLHFRNVRIDLAELNVVEDKDGRKNTDAFQKPEAPREGGSPGRSSQDVNFGGIDYLDISLGKASFVSERYPNRNYERELGVRNRIFTGIKTEKDLETVGVLLIGQIGMSALLERFIAKPAELDDITPLKSKVEPVFPDQKE